MNKLPPLIELRAFDAAARHLSFKKAAAELGVTPTAISHQIRLLERYCGRALFRRRPRPLSLTEAGARLFPDHPGRTRSFCAAFAAVRRDGDLTAPPRDDDKCLCEPLACAAPAALEEVAPQRASRRDRHGRRFRLACRRCRRRHPLCPHVAARRHGQGILERFLLARLQSRIAWPRAGSALQAFVDRFSFIVGGHHPISGRQLGRNGSPLRDASGATCRNPRTWITSASGRSCMQSRP